MAETHARACGEGACARGIPPALRRHAVLCRSDCCARCVHVSVLASTRVCGAQRDQVNPFPLLVRSDRTFARRPDAGLPSARARPSRALRTLSFGS